MKTLPDLRAFINSTLLVHAVLNAVGTEMRHTNGSPLDEALYSLMSPAFSISLLPTGAWEEIDSVLPDDIDVEDYYYADAGYISRLSEDCMNIGYFKWNIDAGGEYGGNVSPESGIILLVYSFWASYSEPESGFSITAQRQAN